MPAPVEFAELEASLRRFIGRQMRVSWVFADGEVVEGSGVVNGVIWDAKAQERDWTKEEARRTAERSPDRGAIVPIQAGVQYWVDADGFSSRRIGGTVIFNAELVEEDG